MKIKLDRFIIEHDLLDLLNKPIVSNSCLILLKSHLPSRHASMESTHRRHTHMQSSCRSFNDSSRRHTVLIPFLRFIHLAPYIASSGYWG